MDNSNLNYKIVPKKYYVIEGEDETEGQSCENDFFNKLKFMTQSKCAGDDSVNDTDTDNNCLLTKEALKDIHVTLNCGHKFNYIFHYIIKHWFCQARINTNPEGSHHYDICVGKVPNYSKIDVPISRLLQNVSGKH